MRRAGSFSRVGLVAAVLFAVSACSETPQDTNAAGVKTDDAPYQGVGDSQYAQAGWKVGDKGSWEQQLKSRAQYGQNDYSRMGTQPLKVPPMTPSSAPRVRRSLISWRAVIAGCLLALGAGWASAQTAAQKAPLPPDDPPPASAATAPAVGGIQSANIFQIAPDASADPNYATQSNAERKQVQPGNNAPMWRDVGKGVTGYSSLPDPEAGNLIQPFVQYPGSSLTNAGEAWRQVRNDWLIPYGGSLLLIVALAIALFYFSKGTIALHGAETGRKIERFTYVERSAHWLNAIAFVCLAVSGIVMAFGKFFLLPVIGSTLFGWLSYALKNLHNFTGPLFAVSLLVVIVAFARDNMPGKGDLTWLLRGGGLLSAHEVPSHRFNAGEKVLFWAGVFLMGLLVAGSGLFLDKIVPAVEYTRGNMQVAHMIHAAAAVLMMAMFMGHIYMGTLGMSGAFQAMKTGYVDETWAREHHEYWYDDIKAGKIPAQRSKLAVSSAVGEATAKA